MNMLIKTINGWDPPSPVKCTPTQITQVKSKTNSVGDLIIDKILSEKIKFDIEWKFLTKDQVKRIMSEVKNFDALVAYEDLTTGEQKEGRFYPGDRQPVPCLINEDLYESFSLTLIQK